MTYETVPTPVAGQAIMWFDTTGNIPATIDGNGLCYATTKNGAIAAQGAGFAADTWVTNSDLLIPSFGCQSKTVINWRISGSKSGAGTATPIYIIRMGSARSTADAAWLTLTGPAQTAIADIGTLNIMAILRTISASVGVIQASAWWDHTGTAASTTVSGTGFANNVTGHVEATSGSIDTSVATTKGKYLSLSLNGGTSAAWTLTQVQGQVDW